MRLWCQDHQLKCVDVLCSCGVRGTTQSAGQPVWGPAGRGQLHVQHQERWAKDHRRHAAQTAGGGHGPRQAEGGNVRHTLRPPSTPALRPITESLLMFHAGGVAAVFSSNAEERYQCTTSVDINNTRYKRLQSLVQNHVRSESAREQRIVLYKSYE